MNIFKPFYKETKDYLMRYGDWRKNKHIFIENELAFETIKDTTTKKWFKLIYLYLNNFCDEEDRRFIQMLYFKKNKVGYVAMHFPMCERACQEWREEILKNMILLAVHEEILRIELNDVVRHVTTKNDLGKTG